MASKRKEVLEERRIRGEFTELDEPIKIRWYNQKSRSRLFDMSACAHLSDGSHENEPYYRGASFECYRRQKTNIVIEYLEEAAELHMDLKHDWMMGASTRNSSGGSVSQTPTMNKKYGEVYHELREELEKRGYDPDSLRGELKTKS